MVATIGGTNESTEKFRYVFRKVHVLLNTNYENYLGSTIELTEKFRYVSTEVHVRFVLGVAKSGVLDWRLVKDIEG